MSHTAYPVGSDLQAYLEAAGLNVTRIAAQLTSAVGSARQQFETDCRRRLLAVPQTRPLDPPANREGLLELRADLASTDADGNPAVIEVRYQGQLLTAGVDYWLEPYEAPFEGWPYSEIRFDRRWWTPFHGAMHGALTVSGPWGYGTTLSDLAWEGILASAALVRLPQLQHGISGGLVSWKNDLVAQTYGDRPLEYLSVGWAGTRAEAVKALKRATI